MEVYMEGVYSNLSSFMIAGQGYFMYKEYTNSAVKKITYKGVTHTLENWEMSFEEFLARSHMEWFFILAMILTVLLLISVPIGREV